MKALTISQPDASLIADRHKFVENRTWETSYRGLLAIHAGKGTQYLTPEELAQYPTSCIVAVAELVDCLPFSVVTCCFEWGEGWRNFTAQQIAAIAEHPHTEGPYCWLLKNRRKLSQPIPCAGRQGLWTLPDGFIQMVSARLPGNGDDQFTTAIS